MQSCRCPYVSRTIGQFPKRCRRSRHRGRVKSEKTLARQHHSHLPAYSNSCLLEPLTSGVRGRRHDRQVPSRQRALARRDAVLGPLPLVRVARAVPCRARLRQRPAGRCVALATLDARNGTDPYQTQYLFSMSSYLKKHDYREGASKYLELLGETKFHFYSFLCSDTN